MNQWIRERKMIVLLPRNFYFTFPFCQFFQNLIMVSVSNFGPNAKRIIYISIPAKSRRGHSPTACACNTKPPTKSKMAVSLSEHSFFEKTSQQRRKRRENKKIKTFYWSLTSLPVNRPNANQLKH